jgi:hypothetical protein
MARKVELAVGQHRELKSPRRPRRGEAEAPKARVEIIALGVAAELYGGGDNYRFWKLHTDMVHVRMVDAGDWAWEVSSRQCRERALGRDPNVASYASHERKYLWERLPADEYLVKPALLGSLWGDEQDSERVHAERVAEAKRRYEAAVERQRGQLTQIFNGARVSAVPISWGHSGTLSLNALAALINHGAGRQRVPEVHWRDYDPDQQVASESA